MCVFVGSLVCLGFDFRADVGVGFVLSIAQQLLIPEGLSDPSGMGQAIGIGFSAVCNGICGVIVAIPLMVSGSGMDNSKLFG